MEKKENSNLEGKLCYYGKELVLVLEKKKRIFKISSGLKQYCSYDVLFSKGGIDQVGEKRLNVID
jgi:hypothetical protein